MGVDEVLTAWRTRRLDGEAYPYLFADATYQKVRENGRVVSKGMLSLRRLKPFHIKDTGPDVFKAVLV